MGKLFSCFKALIFLSIIYMFENFPAISDKHQYVASKINSDFTNEISQNNPQSFTASYSRKRYMKYLEKFPNVPFQFLSEMKNNNGQHCYNIKENENIIYNERNINKLFNITINNQYWQQYISRSGVFYLYNAYLDTRGNYSSIQILAIAERAARNDVHKCAIWYKNSGDPDSSLEPMKMNPINKERPLLGIEEIKMRKLGIQNSVRDINNMSLYILTCKIPNRRNRIPQAVSIVDHRSRHIYKNSNCYATTNYLKVNHNYGEKKDFAVCVKGYFFQRSHSTRLIEWIELLTILGAKKIFLYELEGNPDVWKVFDFYIKKGILDVTKCTIPGDPNFGNNSYLKKYLRDPVRRDAPIFLNDCLYRNIYKYKFIANTDIDEVIVPRELGHTWSDMMASPLTMYKNASSYFFQNTYFFDDVPEYIDIPKTNHMLRHVYRSKNVSNGKGFFNTEFVKIVNNHRAAKCTFKPCKEAKIKSTVALVHHYRKGCQEGIKGCYKNFRKDIILDTRLWEFKDKLLSRSNETLSKLDMEVL